MHRIHRRLALWAVASVLLGLLAIAPVALAQRGGAQIMFLARRPPRDLPNIRAWASGNRTNSYNEDVSSHSWRVTFIMFLSRAPNVPEVTVSWFHIEPDRSRRYISNEPIALGNPSDRIFFFSTALHRGAGQFEPMENYEAVVSVNDSRGVHELGRGRVGLVGQVERRSGVVDFTREPSPPPSH
jgi:hypothetical protein